MVATARPTAPADSSPLAVVVTAADVAGVRLSSGATVVVVSAMVSAGWSAVAVLDATAPSAGAVVSDDPSDPHETTSTAETAIIVVTLIIVVTRTTRELVGPALRKLRIPQFFRR